MTHRRGVPGVRGLLTVWILLFGGCGPEGDGEKVPEPGASPAAESSAVPATLDPLRLLTAAADSGALDRAAALLQEGLEARRAGKESEASARFSEAATEPGMADWAAILAAEVDAGRGDTAAVTARLVALPPDLVTAWGWRLLSRARREAGDAPVALRVVLQALPGLTVAVDSAEAYRLAAAAALDLADTTAARHFSALALLAAPAAPEASEAASLLARLGARRAEDHAGLVRHHLAAGDLGGARREWEAARRLDAGDPALAAGLRVELAKAHLARGRGAEAARLTRPDPSDTPAERAALLVLDARDRLGRGRAGEAQALLERATREHPAGPAVQEALFLLADLDQDAGRAGPARERFAAAAEIDRSSEWGGEAAMRLGAMAFLDGNFTVAASVFEAYAAAHPDGWRHQQAGYWAGMTYLRLGQRDTGLDLLRRTRDLEPTGFYALQAARARGDREFAPSIPPGPESDSDAEAVARGALRRIDLLEALGLPQHARVERERALGLLARTPGGLHAFAETLHARGRLLEGVRAARRARSLLGSWDARLLRSVHPLPYREEIEDAARRLDVDPWLVAALVRQESLFDPSARSRAGAVGLMQVMPRTARELAPRTAAGVSPDALGDPRVNLEIGILHLAELVRRYDGRVEEVLVAYNAGAGRLARWRSFPEHGQPDLFIERIPYRETRDYVRTVLENRATYASLYGR